MTKIKMIGRLATPTMMVAPGAIIDVADDIANGLISSGHATLISRTRPPMVEAAIVDRKPETATAAPQKVFKKKR